MDDSLPKYLNSPETPVFNKSGSLYGLNLTRNACRRAGTVYMVEGYFDLIALFQHGIENVAATLGTSLTAGHARILRGFVKKAVLVFDSDEAGTKAAARSIPLFRKENVDVGIMVLPKGHDPDTFVFRFGADAFNQAAEKAMDAISFLTESAVARHGLSIEGKLAVIDDMKGPLAEIDDPVARSLYVRALGEKLDVDQNAVLESIDRATRRIEREKRFAERRRGPEPPQVDPGENVDGKETERPHFRVEKKIVAMMLQCPEMLPDVVAHSVLEYIEDEDLKFIGQTILLHHDLDGPARAEPSELFPHLENDVQRKLVASLAMDDEDCWIERDGRKKQLILQLMESALARREKPLTEKIRAAEETNDTDLLLKLLEKKQKMVLSFQEMKMALLKKASNMNNFE